MSDRVEIRGMQFDAEDVRKIDDWTTYVAQMLDAGFDPATIRDSVAALAEAATQRYPQLELGEPVALRRADSGPTLTWPTEILNRFIELTGDVLFAAADGPHLAGDALRGAIERLDQRRSKGRETHGEGTDA